MAIPTVQTGNVVAAPYPGAPVNAQALMAPGRGMQAIARGLSDVSGVAEHFAQRAQHAKNVAAITDAEVRIERASDDYQEKMRLEPDEAKWKEGYEKTISQEQAKLGIEKMAPEVRDPLQNSLKVKVESHASRIGTQASKRGVERSRVQLTTAAEYFYNKGNFEEGGKALDNAVATGVMFQEAADAMKTDLMRRSEMNRGYAAVQADPFLAEAAIDEKTYPHLSQQQLYSLKNSANGEQTRLQGETQNDVLKRRMAGDMISEDEVQAMVAQNKVSPTWARGFLKQQTLDTREDGRHGPAAEARYYDLKTQAAAFDRDRDGEAGANKIKFAATEGLSAKLAEDIFKVLDSRDPAKKGALTTPAAKFGLETIEANFKGGIYGHYEEADLLGGGKKINPAGFAAATRLRAQITDEMTTFVKKNPDASLTEVTDYLGGLNEKHVVGSGRAAVAPLFGTPQKAQSTNAAQARWEALKAAQKK